jgi:A/G-specific adenine glycosylase
MTLPADILNRKRAFRGRLLRWYAAHRRPLPWRETQDPYRVWVSEIMLQQTRVNAVLGHYRRFLKQFPTVRSLARASEAEVLAAWSGLGYYRRARMMRRAAQKIMAHGGHFPSTAAALRELPGIGRYTAAAIASIAFDEATAVVDGNVERVISRMAGRKLSAAAVWEFAEAMIPAERPGDFNQAMMELGAMVCTPQAPRCGECPVRGLCAGRGELAKGPTATRTSAELHYAWARRADKVRLVKRGAEESLMAGMWELPGIEPNGHEPVLRLRHAITTTDYRVAVYALPGGKLPGRWVAAREAASLPLTGLARKVLLRLGAIASLR